jgi:ABC-type multidrug transport system fused ATPase/permease subunit
MDCKADANPSKIQGSVPNEVRKSARLLDHSQRPAYFPLMIQEWLKLVLNLVVMVLAVVMVTLSVRLHANSAFVGASLYSLITFGENLAGLVLYYTKLENSLGAVARLNKFSADVLPEDRESEDTTPPATWPASSAIEFKGVSAGYT